MALFEIFHTLCNNLCQPTRLFMFSNWKIQCPDCDNEFVDCVLQFNYQDEGIEQLTIEKNIVSNWQPCLNSSALHSLHADTCPQNLPLATNCAKLGPLIVVHLHNKPDKRHYKLEDQQLALGQKLAHR